MKKLKYLCISTIASLTVMSLSVLLTPLSQSYDPIDGTQAVTYIIFCLFWLGLITGIVTTVLASSVRKKIRSKSKSPKNLPGIITFFRNAESTASAAVCLLGIILTVVMRISNNTSHAAVQFIGLFMALWGFSMHCVLDGLNYRAVKRASKKRTVAQVKEETK